MHSTVCITVLNEEATIERLLNALANQTLRPQEIIITDGGSHDRTLAVATAFGKKNPKLPVRIISVKGNRSVGRNAAIRRASSEWLAITDAGCVPRQDWLAELTKTQQRSQAKVVAGYYEGLPSTPLEEAMVPYVLVMPDRVDPDKFLPATRSLLIHKSIWQKAGGFDESLSDNEDYAFARNIAKLTKIAFARNAIVSWLPRQNLRQFFWMLFRFARGDIQAEILRPKVLLLFVRYLIALAVVTWLVMVRNHEGALLFIVGGLLLYSIWAIAKNKRYTQHGWHWLPVLQLTADVAVFMGSIASVHYRISFQKRN